MEPIVITPAVALPASLADAHALLVRDMLSGFRSYSPIVGNAWKCGAEQSDRTPRGQT